MKKILLLSSVLVLNLLYSRAQSVQENFWETNGRVNATLKLNNKLFVGGEFNYIGPSNGSLGAFQSSNSQVINNGLKINGPIKSMIKDNAGNIYLGGNFSVNGGSYKSLIKLNSSLVPDLTFEFQIDGTVNDLAINNNVLYFAGSFNNINNQLRLGFAAIELSTNSLSSFAPNPDGQVNTLEVGNGSLYVGGNFAIISGTSRNALASYNGSKALQPLNISVKGSVQTLGIRDSLLFIAGNFDSIGGLARINLASLNTSTNLIRNWRADVTGTIADMDFSGNNLYIAGNFYQVGIESRNHLAAINVLTQAISSFNPGFDGAINSIDINGTSLYAGGNFNSVGINNRSYLAKINLSSGSSSGNLPNLNEQVYAVQAIGDTLLFGGMFSSFGGNVVNNFALLDYNTGMQLSISMDINGVIKDFEMVGSQLLIAGDFNFINNANRNGVAIIDTATGVPSAWDIQSDGAINDALVSGNNIYLAGNFTQLGLTTRNYLAQVNATTASIGSWNPNANGSASKLLLNQAQLYAIGNFNQIGSNTRKSIASFDLSANGNLRSWNINPDSNIFSMASNGKHIFIGGMFNNIGSASRNYLAAIDTGDASVSNWNPQILGSVRSVFEDNGSLFVGGEFSTQSSTGFACFSVSNGNEIDFPFKPVSGMVSSINKLGSQLFLGGHFELKSGKKDFAVVNLNVVTPTIQANNLNISGITPNQMTLKFNKGNGAKYVVLAKQGSAVDSIPTNGIALSADNAFGSGQSLGNNYVVYNGSDTSFNITSLNPGSNYHFAVFTYNGISNNTNYLVTNPARATQTTITGYNPPTTAGSNIQFSQNRTTQVMVKWTKGNGTARYLVAREGSAVNQIPTDSNSYNANAEFGFGDDIGSSNYVVYSSTGDSVLVTNLKAGTTYHFKLYEYNGDAQFRRVLTTGPIANSTTLSLAAEPTNSATAIGFSNITIGSMQLNWTNGNGVGRIVIASKNNPVSTLGNDGEAYFSDNTFNGASSYLSNDERVVYVGSGNQFTLSGLEPNTNYHFAVLEYNGSNFTINYQATGYAVGEKKTLNDLNFPSIPSKNISLTKIDTNNLQFLWSPGNGEKRLVAIRKDAAVSGFPEIGKSYNASNIYGNGDSLSDGSYVVLADVGNSVSVIGLTPNTIYHVAIFEFNNSPIGSLYYLDSFATGNTQTLPPTGLIKIKGTGFLKAYPNPIYDGLLYLEFDKVLSKDAQITLFDISGKIILEKQLEANSQGNYQLNLDKICTGDYFVKVISGKDNFQSKIRVN
jgi:hypothetical protein